MSKRFDYAVPAVLAAALVFPPAASTVAADEPPILHLRAFAVDLNNRVRTNTIDIAIERWSTPEETAKLKAVLVEKGPDKLLSALQDVKPRCGYARTSTSLGWDTSTSRRKSCFPTAGGRSSSGATVLSASGRRATRRRRTRSRSRTTSASPSG